MTMNGTLKKISKTSFKIVESYKHKEAKKILKRWLKRDFVRIVAEEKFCMKCHIWFIPDLTCYSEKGIDTLYEIVHKSDISEEKKLRMKVFFKCHGWEDIKVYKVSAEWIMNQIKKPKNIVRIQVI